MAKDDHQRTDFHIVEPLTRREYDVLALLAYDLSDREIADRLTVSSNTVKWYNRQIYDKLGVDNRRQAVEHALSLGLLDQEQPTEPPLAALPAQSTAFIGRAGELEDLTHLLGSEATRLITLLAPGGMGKTRLALATAETCQSQFASGVCFIPLTPLTSPEQLVPAIAEFIGLHLTSDQRTPKQQLTSFLSNKHILLVLDNFEQVLDGAGLLADLLEAAPHLHLLVTSRQRLNLSCETLYVVSGLTYPDSSTVENALDYTAVQLFLECGQRLRPQMALEDLTAVVKICQMTQGMPLAVELAAAWLIALSPSEVADEIARGLDFLQTNLRDIPERQRSVVAVFETSWRQLSAEEQSAFRKLSIFRGGFKREAALDVADTRVDILIGLANKALISRNSRTSRFEMHELLRQFAEEQLKLSDELEATRGRHAAYFADFLHARLPMLQSRNPKAALNEIQADFDNVRQAILHLLDLDRSNTLEGVAKSLRIFFEADVHFSSSVHHPGLPYLSLRLFFEARAHFSDDAVTIFRMALAKGYSAEIEVILREGLGDALHVTGAYDLARQQFEQAKRLLPANANIQHARLLRKRASTLDAQRRLEEALRVLSESEQTLDHADERDAAWWQEWIAVQNGIVSAYFFLSIVEPIVGRTDTIRTAVERYGTSPQRFDFYVSANLIELLRTRFVVTERAMEYGRLASTAALETGSLLQVAIGHFRVGLTYFAMEDWEAAETDFRTALALADRIGNVLTQTICIAMLTLTYRRCNRVETVEQWAKQTLEIASNAEIDLYIAAGKANLAWVSWRRGKIERAVPLAQEALTIWQKVSPHYPVRWQAHWILLGNALHENRLGDAVDYARELLDQQALNRRMEPLLMTMIQAWDEGNRSTIGARLAEISALATSLGYL